ncbi:unnamed protein product [Closterium sp. NIES-53]
MAQGQQASAKGMAVEGAEDKGEADLAATISMEAGGVADTIAITRATDAFAADSTASATIVKRADICGAIATSSLMDGLLLKAKRVEEQEEGEEEAEEAVAVAEKDEGFEEPAAVEKVTLHFLDYWVIDSGAIYSMTPRADLLTELEPSPVKHVTSALGQRAEVKGMGKAMFKGADGKMVGLKNVLWVSNLAANLISVRRLQKAGMDTSSKGAKTYTARLGEWILWDLHEDRDVYNEMWQIPVVPMPKERQVPASISTKGEAVGIGDGANGRAKEIKSKKCNLGGTSKLGEHEESGAAAKEQHKGEENPKAATEEEYGESMWGTIGEPDEVLGCPTCMQDNFTRYPFSIAEATAKTPLDEVVMDVVGPLKLGAAGAEYFLTIVDVYTRMTWVYVLSKKSDVAETVKTDWLPMVERQQDWLVKAIRTDRGGEFLSNEFSLWLKKNGIRHSLTMPYSSAMNGIAERANRTITETARGLLIEAGLPDYFWPDAVRSACVAKNRALTHVGADKWVPYVEWIGRKPKVDMLRVFECMCMALVPKHLRHNKLGAKAIWVVHLGMAQNKRWLLWDPFTKKLLVSKDCKFMENLMYKDWKAENEANIGMRFGEVKSSGLEHVELLLEMSCGSTTTRQASLVNGGEEAKDAEDEEEEMQQVSERAPTLPSRTTNAPRIRVTPQQRQGLHVPAAEEEGRGKRRIQAPNRLTYDALGKPAKSALAGAALMVGDDEESDYEECAFAFFSPVEMLGEPATLTEALESSDAEEWKKAMESELKSIEENGTWELVELPEGRKAIMSKWLFKIKSDADGKIERYKSRLVAKGYQQKEKVEYKELFAPVEIGFTLSSADHSFFMLGEGEQRSFMVVYVDDILIFSPSSDLVKEVMLKLQDKFKCKALGDVSFYLGLHIERDVEKRCMRVHQRKYLEALAANFGQSEGHVATPFPSGFKCVKGPEEESVGEEERRRFHSLVGSLMYAAVDTQPDVAFATEQLARVVQCPNEEQVAAGMRVAKYLGQTPTVGLQYSAAAQRRQKGADGVEPGRLFLTAFSDASFASEPEDMTSVGGFICCVGGGPTAWESKNRTALHCPPASAAVAATTATLATAPTAAMASLTILTFDAEGRAVDFDVWVDDLQLFLQYDSRDGVSLFNHTSGVSTAPAATADSTVRSQDHFLSLCATELTFDLLEERLTPAEKSILAVGAFRGDRRTPFFEGCSPVPLLPSVASAAAVDLVGNEEVGATSAPSRRRRNSKGKGSKGGGGCGGGGGGGAGGGRGAGVSSSRATSPNQPHHSQMKHLPMQLAPSVGVVSSPPAVAFAVAAAAAIAGGFPFQGMMGSCHRSLIQLLFSSRFHSSSFPSF